MKKIFSVIFFLFQNFVLQQILIIKLKVQFEKDIYCYIFLIPEHCTQYINHQSKESN